MVNYSISPNIRRPPNFSLKNSENNFYDKIEYLINSEGIFALKYFINSVVVTLSSSGLFLMARRQGYPHF
jgi:hypothetical protein